MVRTRGELNMKIARVEAIHLRIPEVQEIADGTQDVLVVRIQTDSGLEGIGEVTSQSYVCKAIFEAPPSAARRHGLAHLLLGQDPLDVEGLWERMYYHTNRYGRRGAAIHAISGADIALWDLRGKILGKPVCELLGGQKRTSVRAYASYLFGASPKETHELAKQAVNLGLTAVKFGWGVFGKDAGTDLAHVEAAEKRVGKDRALMVDAGHAWTLPWHWSVRGCSNHSDISWLEEPLSQDDLKGYAELCPLSPVPIAAGEGEVTQWGFQSLLDSGIHVIQPDVAFCGGLTVSAQVSQMAQRAGRRCVRIASAPGSIWLPRFTGWLPSLMEISLSIAFGLRH